MTERELLERFVAEQDEHAFRVLVENHGRMVLAVCRSVLREPFEVEDAFQRTFLLLVRKAGTIGRRAALGPWLHRAALRIAMQIRCDAERRGAHRQRASSPAIEPVETVPGQDLDDKRRRGSGGDRTGLRLGRLCWRVSSASVPNA